MDNTSYFSVSFDLIVTNQVLEYDLYVNSSSISSKQKFVKVFAKNNELSNEDLEEFKNKYPRLYVSEEHRSKYMKSLAKSQNIKDEEATNFIKDSALKYLHGIFDNDKEFSTELLSQTIEGCRDAVESMIDVLDDYNIESLRGLIGNLSEHDFYTYDHSINVSMYCIIVLRAYNPKASRNELMHAGLGGLLHDLGKIKISTNILNKPSGLTDEEYEEIKKHPTFGVELLSSGEVHCAEDIDLKVIARIINEHHENWDGKGYPSQLAAEQIHLFARVCCVADFFDAITTKRSYSDVLTISRALEVMEKTVGKKLDPKIFKLFSKHVSVSKVESAKQLRMNENFDPSIPYAKFPIEEIEEEENKSGFGKVRLLEETKKKD